MLTCLFFVLLGKSLENMLFTFLNCFMCLSCQLDSKWEVNKTLDHLFSINTGWVIQDWDIFEIPWSERWHLSSSSPPEKNHSTAKVIFTVNVLGSGCDFSISLSQPSYRTLCLPRVKPIGNSGIYFHYEGSWLNFYSINSSNF